MSERDTVEFWQRQAQDLESRARKLSGELAVECTRVAKVCRETSECLATNQWE